MDETGWREDGINGYVWCACTPQVRYYQYHHSRGSEVVKAVLGESFAGVLGSDFYASSNVYAGLHQRCWVHLLGERHELKEQHPQSADVQQWAKGVKAVYDRAVAYAGPDPRLPPAKQEAARRKLQRALEQELWQLCAPYAHTSSPLHTLCERVERFLPELFVCVAVPGVPAENHLAERSVRPLVIARKSSGGTRSPEGSETRMGLFSLFGTWAAEATQSIPAMPCRSLPSSVFTTNVNTIQPRSCFTASVSWGILLDHGGPRGPLGKRKKQQEESNARCLVVKEQREHPVCLPSLRHTQKGSRRLCPHLIPRPPRLLAKRNSPI